MSEGASVKDRASLCSDAVNLKARPLALNTVGAYKEQEQRKPIVTKFLRGARSNAMAALAGQVPGHRAASENAGHVCPSRHSSTGFQGTNLNRTPSLMIANRPLAMIDRRYTPRTLSPSFTGLCSRNSEVGECPLFEQIFTDGLLSAPEPERGHPWLTVRAIQQSAGAVEKARVALIESRLEWVIGQNQIARGSGSIRSSPAAGIGSPGSWTINSGMRSPLTSTATMRLA